MIRTSVDGGAFTITLDRPDRRNALTLSAITAVSEALDEAGATDSVRLVVLTGAAAQFCSGADLTDVLDPAYRETLVPLLDRLAGFDRPTLAVVEGYALGAGTQLAAACDLRLSTPDAEFGVPAARLGIAVDQWTIDRMTHLCGASLAAGLLVGGLRVSGTRAHELGFVHRLGGERERDEWVEALVAAAPLTLAAHKLGIAGAPTFAEARTRAWESADLQEGVAAFHERRSPTFDGT